MQDKREKGGGRRMEPLSERRVSRWGEKRRRSSSSKRRKYKIKGREERRMEPTSV